MNEITPSVKIGKDAFIKGSVIEGNTIVEENCRIYDATIKGNVQIGRYSSLWGPNITILSKVNKIVIGNFCSIARNVTIQEFNHNMNKRTTYYVGKNIFHEKWENENVSKGDIVIGNDVWIGGHCVILSGVKIGNGAVIAANSVVSSDVPDYAIVAGSPAKVIKYRFDSDTIKTLQEEKWWQWDIDTIKKNKHLFEETLTIN